MIEERAETMTRADKVKVVLFCGGRGAQLLSKELINAPQVALTFAINGYDDGASTGTITSTKEAHSCTGIYQPVAESSEKKTGPSDN